MRQQSGPAGRPSTTSIVDLVHTQIRRARSRTTEKQRSEPIRQLAKDEMTRHTAKAVERVRTLVIDTVDRGAPLEECEEPLQLLLADVRQAYWAKHGPDPLLSLADAHQLEELAEGEKEEAETAFAYAPTLANATRLLIAQAKHRRADEAYERVVRSRALTAR